MVGGGRGLAAGTAVLLDVVAGRDAERDFQQWGRPGRSADGKAAVLFSFDPPERARGKLSERMDFWKDPAARGLFPVDSLVAVVRSGEPVAIAVVIRRRDEELARTDVPDPPSDEPPAPWWTARPVIGLTFPHAEALAALLEEGLRSYEPDGVYDDLALVQITSSFFSYRPVLAWCVV